MSENYEAEIQPQGDDRKSSCLAVAKRTDLWPHKVTIRKMLYCGILLMSCLTPALLAYSGPNDPSGDWRVSDGMNNIRIAQCNGDMWGVISWEKTPGVDKENHDASKRSRPTLGMPVLIDMKKNPETDAWEGQVYNAKNGKTYKSTMKLLAPDKLEVKGCVLGFLCGGDTWTRVGSNDPESTRFTSDVCSLPDVARRER